MTEEMTAKKMLDYRIKLHRDAADFKITDRTPFNANVVSWLFHDAGYTTSKACRDYKIIEECMIRFLKKYRCDMFNYTMSGFRNVFLLADSMGGSIYTEDGDDSGLNIVAEDYIKPEEFDEVIANFRKALWERVIFRMYPEAKEFSPERFAQAVKTMYVFQHETTRINDEMRDVYGIPVEKNIAHIMQPMEFLFGNLRGIKGLSSDLRRMPEKIKEFSDKQVDSVFPYYQKQVEAFKGHDMNEAYDCMTGILAHTIMNQKQFDMFIAPSLDRAFKVAEENGKQVVIFSEGQWARFGDFFNQYKKGTLNMTVEMDDPFEIRKKYGNICISGGLSVDLLRVASKEKCVDAAKKAIDELGANGGLILSPNKMLAYPTDAKSENLKAVADFVVDYRG